MKQYLALPQMLMIKQCKRDMITAAVQVSKQCLQLLALDITIPKVHKTSVVSHVLQNVVRNNALLFFIPHGFLQLPRFITFQETPFSTQASGAQPVYAAEAGLGLLDRAPSHDGLSKPRLGFAVFTWSYVTSFHLLSHTPR